MAVKVILVVQSLLAQELRPSNTESFRGALAAHRPLIQVKSAFYVPNTCLHFYLVASTRCQYSGVLLSGLDSEESKLECNNVFTTVTKKLTP